MRIGFKVDIECKCGNKEPAITFETGDGTNAEYLMPTGFMVMYCKECGKKEIVSPVDLMRNNHK